MRCSFAHPGTYGHECGQPATWAGYSVSTGNPHSACINDRGTLDGVFWHRRCDKCKEIKGGENSAVRHWESFNPQTHVNKWA